MDQYIKDLIKTELQKQKSEFQKKQDELQKQNCELKKRIDEIEERVFNHKGEKFYQKQLEKMLGGGHTRTKHGFTDITTDDAIYEIKEWKNYKACFGQLKSYSVGNETKRLCAAFFGQVREDRRQEIVELFRNNNMEIYELTYTSEMFRLDNPKEDSEDKQRSEFYKWLDKNIEYNENGYLSLKEIFSLYFKDNINVDVKIEENLKKEIENWIKIKIPSINNNCKRTTINGISFRGWEHLGLIEDINYNKNEFYKWLDENVEHKINGLLQLKDVCISFLGNSVSSRISTVYKKEIENWIKQKHSFLNEKYRDTTFNSQKVRGWIGLKIINIKDLV